MNARQQENGRRQRKLLIDEHPVTCSKMADWGRKLTWLTAFTSARILSTTAVICLMLCWVQMRAAAVAAKCKYYVMSKDHQLVFCPFFASRLTTSDEGTEVAWNMALGRYFFPTWVVSVALYKSTFYLLTYLLIMSDVAYSRWRPQLMSRMSL